MHTLKNGLAVTIFFALSGFLITYLLLVEKKQGEIKIEKFYLRRIFRIWPIYYLYLFISIVLSFIYWQNLLNISSLFYFFLLANIPPIFFNSLPLLSHYWSLGVEEQFYLFWPHVLKNVKFSSLYIIIFSFILIFNILKYLIYHHSVNINIDKLYIFISSFRIDCMAIGGLGALFLYFKNLIILKIIYNKFVQLVS